MFPSARFLLLAITLTAYIAHATTIVVPFDKVQKSGAFLKGLPNAQRVRAAGLKKVGSGVTVPATNLDYVQYTVSVGVGQPPTNYSLVVDTGSSNTFVGCVRFIFALLILLIYCNNA
jgi:Eukaryotic aspartyl protease